MDLGLTLRVSTGSAVPFLKSLISSNAATDESADTWESGDVRIDCYHGWPADRKLIVDWEDLLTRVLDATVFQTPHWQRGVLAWTARTGQLRLFALRRAGRLIGVLPLQLLSFGRLLAAGWMLSDYLEPLIDPAEQETFWRHLLTFARTGPVAYRRLHLQHLKPQSASIATLRSISRDEGFTLEQRPNGCTLAIDLPQDWEAYLAMLPPRDRKELRRKLNKAASQGDARLAPAENEADAHSTLNRIFTFIETNGGERWLKSRWIYRDLFQDIGQELVRSKWLRPYLMSLCGKPAAGLITFSTREDVLMAWSTGFDPSFRAWSPGIVTFSMVIQDAIRRGVRCLDLLRGDPDYKLRLGAKPRPLYDLILRPAM